MAEGNDVRFSSRRDRGDTDVTADLQLQLQQVKKQTGSQRSTRPLEHQRAMFLCSAAGGVECIRTILQQHKLPRPGREGLRVARKTITPVIRLLYMFGCLESAVEVTAIVKNFAYCVCWTASPE